MSHKIDFLYQYITSPLKGILVQKSLGIFSSNLLYKKKDICYLFSQEWETEAVDLDMAGLGSQEDLRLDLAGGRDDLHCPNDKPIYVSSIAKGSFLEGKLK